MDTDENVINTFANTLRNHNIQRTVSLYCENQSRGNSGEETYEIKDVISGVAKQLKAIQNADSFKNRPKGKGIPNRVKKSTFLPVHMVSVDQLPKPIQSHNFETQCVLDTQLINIIDNAEAIIDAEKGITQEFDTTFCHKDLDNGNDKSVDDELFNISQKHSAIDNKHDESKSPVIPNHHSVRDKIHFQLHDCNISVNRTYALHTDAEIKMIQEFDTVFCHTDSDSIENKNDCHKNQENDNKKIPEKNWDDKFLAENYKESDSIPIADTFKKKNDKEALLANRLSSSEEKTINDITIRDLVPKTDVQCESIEVCDNFHTQYKFYSDTSEDDNDSQNENLINNPKSNIEEPNSPILNEIRPKVTTHTPSPLIFELESFEKFETIALPVLENHDFETAKKVINSQILNRELFIYTHAEAVLNDRDKDIQTSPILKSCIKSEPSNVRCTDNKLNLEEDSILFSSDEENDFRNSLEELPLTCALQKSFCNEPDILEKTMYVGNQTASNRSIKISTDSYCKAKSIFDNLVNIERENLSGKNVNYTTATTKNIDKLDHANINADTKSNDDNIADYFKTENGESFNVIEHMDTMCNNEDIIKINAENSSDDIDNLAQIHDCDISGSIKMKLTKEGNAKQESIKLNADDQLSNTGTIKDKLDNNFTEHLKIDNHIIEEFNTDLIAETTQNKIGKLTKNDISHNEKTSKPPSQMIKEMEINMNVIKPIKNDFVGFRTANNKMIKITTEALMKTKNIFENIDSDDILPRKSEKQRFENLFSLHKTKSETEKINEEKISRNSYPDRPSKSWSSFTMSSSNLKLIDTTDRNGKNNKDLISADNKEIKLRDIAPCKPEKKLNDDDNYKSYSRLICDNNVYDERNSINKSEMYVYNLEPNSQLQSFKTASNKPVAISKQALDRTNKIFQNIDNNDTLEKAYYPVQNTESNAFHGLTTANNKPVKISETALAKSKNIFQDIENNQETIDIKTPTFDINNQSSNVLKGFATANNKPIKISKTALAKTKNIFQDIDIEKNAENYGVLKILTSSSTGFQGFSTANNKPIPITMKQLAKSKDIFQDIFDTRAPNVEFSNFRDQTSASIVDSNQKPRDQLQAFETASNKSVENSKEALFETKNKFDDIDDHKENIYDFDNFANEKQPYPIDNSYENATCMQGFKTAANKPVGISAEALAKSKKIFQDIDDEERNFVNNSGNILKEKKQLYPVSHTSQDTAIYQGFKTAANKPVGISAEAFAKSKKIFQDIDDKEINIVNDSGNIIKEKQLYSISHISQNDLCQGFKTAGNKPVQISNDALARSKKIFENIDIDSGEIQISNEKMEKRPESIPKKQGNFIGFNTASNKKVVVSETALLKSRQFLQDTDLDLKNENLSFKIPSNLDIHKIKAIDQSVCNFGFKTGNNTQINISEEALRKSRNLFSNLDEPVKANADPKKIPDDVISEKDILEDLNTEIIKDFEDTVYTEDFIKDESLKSKRSGSPILSCPKTRKRKKFETPINTKKFVVPINRQNIIKTDTTNVYNFNENYKKIKKYTLKDVNGIEKLTNIKDVDPYVLNLRFETLLDFEFIDERNDIDNDRWTTDKIKRYFLDSVNKRIIPEGWIENHLKMIVWKLVSYEIRFPGAMKNVCTVKNVMEQLKYRYKKELYNVERPVLRKILEKDEVPSKIMILCVASLFVDGVSVFSVTHQTQNIELLLTDGWYAIKASTDRMIDRLVCEGRISIGTKLAIHGAELLNCEQGIAPWEDTSSIRLKISGNSTRRAKWDARLGLHGNGAMLSRLSAVKPEGGRVSRLRTLVTRVYPTLYIEKFPDGSTLTRSERLEHIYQMKYETERQIQMERLYEELERFSDQESQDSEGQCTEDRAMESGSQISRLMKRSRDRDEFRANLTSSQAHMLQQHTLKQKDKLVQKMQDKFQELVKKRGLDTPRNVVPLMKIRVADVEAAGITKAMVTIWKPNETLQEMLTEGTWIDLYNVVPTSVRYSEIQISAGRQSVFRKSKLKETDTLSTLTKTLRRQCYTTKDLQNPSMNTDYNEVDTVGLIFMIEPQTAEFETKNQPFQNIYLTDTDKNIICVNFWGGIKKFGFQNILDTGQVVACVNLQKRAGNTRKNIPQYRATEFTYFTKTPKNDAVRKMMDDLAAKFSSLDKRKFIDDCVALKKNYHIFKCGNTENVSPYRLNTSDYNVYKNKVFIDSPLVSKCTDVNYNLTGLDFESTFKQTDTQDLSPQMLMRKRKVNEKIAKLKMYGEPPPLSPIHIINKSSNTVKAFKNPLTKNDISSNVANPSSLPQNKGENKSSPDDCHENKDYNDGETKLEVLPQNREHNSSVTSTELPQNRVNKIDSSPVLSLNRTYVKNRASINPVKLNFSNAIETVTDSFAEDFDGSPPLSLDNNFVT